MHSYTGHSRHPPSAEAPTVRQSTHVNLQPTRLLALRLCVLSQHQRHLGMRLPPLQRRQPVPGAGLLPCRRLRPSRCLQPRPAAGPFAPPSPTLSGR